MQNLFVVFVGGGIGAVVRFVLGSWIGQRWGRTLPVGTFLINVSGSFFIGLIMTVLAERFMENPAWRLFLVVGFLGGYTTFSTFEYETGRLAADGEYLFAALNVVLSVFVGFVALKMGEFLAKLM